MIYSFLNDTISVSIEITGSDIMRKGQYIQSTCDLRTIKVVDDCAVDDLKLITFIHPSIIHDVWCGVLQDHG